MYKIFIKFGLKKLIHKNTRYLTLGGAIDKIHLN